MKTRKHSIIWIVLFCTTLVFSQKQTKKINENFDVNTDVKVEINAEHSDITVKVWNKNIVSIQGVLEVEGMTQDEATIFFKKWNFEALGNTGKVVINSKPVGRYFEHHDIFDTIDFDFDFESVSHIGDFFEGNFYSEMPPLPPLPPFPEPVIEHLSEIQFDYNAYQKDKKGYLEKFHKRQEKWQKKFEEELKPRLKAYEKKMEQWQKDAAPQMKAFEKRRKKWEEKMKPQRKAYEKKMEAKAKKMEKEIKEKYNKKIIEREKEISKMKKSLIIKVPKGAILKVNVHHGKISLPEAIKTVRD